MLINDDNGTLGQLADPLVGNKVKRLARSKGGNVTI